MKETEQLKSSPKQKRQWFVWLVATFSVFAFAAPFGFAVFCAPTELTDDFIIPADRLRCQVGIIVSLVIQVLLLTLILWRIRRHSFEVTAISSKAISICIMAAVFIFSVYLLLFTYSAEWSFFSADQDVTNVSTAINRTTISDLLPTPYVAAGSSRSFLAHHFSPSILLFLPVYKVASLFESANHNTYNLALAFTLIAGLSLWYYYSYRSLSKFRFLLPLVLIPLAHSFLFFRQILSFHFEVLTLPLLALLVLSVRLQKRTDLQKPADLLRRSWPLITVLYAGIKEDTAVYLGIFAGVYFLFEVIDHYRQKQHAKLSFEKALQSVQQVLKQSIYFRIGIISVLWVVFAMWFRLWLAGENAASWQSYWDTKSYLEAYPQFRKTPHTYFWILLSSGVWLFFSLRSSLVVIMILLFHVVSGMPWHALLESHYSYTLLPFLIAGSIRGLSNIETLFEKNKVSFKTAMLLFFAGTIATDYSLLREKNQPFPLFKQNQLYESVHTMMKLVPADACVQSSFHLSALVPLRARPIPLGYYEGSPYNSTMP
ncbi:MAG: DUF2079 domain-containing protein, partial [Leptonema sp. (in: Bacteria)]|nr:DUF2079 domain-containing protein [Leptonema sp. (in: bacteria)]